MSRAKYLIASAIIASSAWPAFAGGDVLSAYQTYVDGLNSGDAEMAASAESRKKCGARPMVSPANRR